MDRQGARILFRVGGRGTRKTVRQESVPMVLRRSNEHIRLQPLRAQGGAEASTRILVFGAGRVHLRQEWMASQGHGLDMSNPSGHN